MQLKLDTQEEGRWQTKETFLYLINLTEKGKKGRKEIIMLRAEINK
jgi:hypothetical protein